MATRIVKAFLIYRARNGALRVVNRKPNLDWDEVSFEIKVNVPDPWGRLAGAVVIDLPENGPAVVEVQHAEVPDA